MGKNIKNPIEVRAILHFEEGDHLYHIDGVSVHYSMSCEHGLEVEKGMLIERNPEVLKIVKDFIEEAMQQVDTHEEIPEEDSRLNYNGAPDNYTNGASP